jgi:hypothetical protein
MLLHAAGAVQAQGKQSSPNGIGVKITVKSMVQSLDGCWWQSVKGGGLCGFAAQYLDQL